MPVKDCLIMFQEGSCANEGMSDYVPGRILCQDLVKDCLIMFQEGSCANEGLSDYVPGRILCQ